MIYNRSCVVRCSGWRDIGPLGRHGGPGRREGPPRGRAGPARVRRAPSRCEASSTLASPQFATRSNDRPMLANKDRLPPIRRRTPRAMAASSPRMPKAANSRPIETGTTCRPVSSGKGKGGAKPPVRSCHRAATSRRSLRGCTRSRRPCDDDLHGTPRRGQARSGPHSRKAGRGTRARGIRQVQSQWVQRATPWCRNPGFVCGQAWSSRRVGYLVWPGECT